MIDMVVGGIGTRSGAIMRTIRFLLAGISFVTMGSVPDTTRTRFYNYLMIVMPLHAVHVMYSLVYDIYCLIREWIPRQNIIYASNFFLEWVDSHVVLLVI